MRKKWLLLTGLICLFFLHCVIPVKAADASISFNDPTCKVGDSVAVTMTVDPEVAGIDIYLNYDSTRLNYVTYSGGMDFIEVTPEGSKLHVFTYTNSVVAKVTVTLSFTAKAEGQASITIDTVTVPDANGDAMNIAHRGNSVVTIQGAAPATTAPPETTAPPTTEAPTTAAASKEARLVSLVLSPGTLSPAFSPDTYEYKLNVSADTEGLTPQYMPMHAKANAFYWPYINKLPAGQTDFYVRVTAEDGATMKTYHVVIIKAQPQQETTAPPTTEERTTEEETTEEAESTEETESTDESTEESTEEAEALTLTSPEFTITLLDIPEDVKIPENFRQSKRLDKSGNVYEVLIPKDGKSDGCYVVYGEKEDGTRDYYLVDPEENTLQRFWLTEIIYPTESEETTEAPETTPEETTTTEATETLPVTTEGTQPAPTVPPTAPPTTADESFPFGSVRMRWWLVAAGVLLFTFCVIWLIALLLEKNRLNKELHDSQQLSPDEEDAFLGVHSAALPKTEPAEKAPQPVQEVKPEEVYLPASADDFEEVDVEAEIRAAEGPEIPL